MIETLQIALLLILMLGGSAVAFFLRGTGELRTHWQGHKHARSAA